MSDAPGQRPEPSIHATALVLAEAGILIRGPSGAGKSRLALGLIADGSRRHVFARLVGDDRVVVTPRAGRLVASGHPVIAGRIERRGAGIAIVAHEPACVVRIVIDIVSGAAPRWPSDGADRIVVAGIDLPRLSFAAGFHEFDLADLWERLRPVVRP